jgi:hypothetical protein
MRVMEQRRRSAPIVAAALTLGLAAAGCGGGAPEPGADDQALHDEHAVHDVTGTRRVYFVEPRDGATVTTPVVFRFGNEQVTILRIPEGDITEADVRPDVAHYHLGINRECMPAGEVIPQGDPTWIHFGTGAESIEMEELPAGTHRFTVQAGDDLHRAVAGLCETITVTVAG